MTQLSGLLWPTDFYRTNRPPSGVTELETVFSQQSLVTLKEANLCGRNIGVNLVVSFLDLWSTLYLLL